MKDDIFYDQIAQELQAKQMVSGVWARAFSDAAGDAVRARALYIKYRVAQLAQEASQRQDEERKASAEATKHKFLSSTRRFLNRFMMVVCGVLTALFTIEVPFFLFAELGVGLAITSGVFAILSGLATNAFRKAAQRL